MIIELFGLPGSGKTTIAEEMKAEGAILVPMPSRTRLVWDASLFWFFHPFLALKLLVHLMRASRDIWYTLFVNGFFGYAARYRRAQTLSRTGETAVLDQGFFQLFISLHELPFALLEALPRPDLLVVVTTDVSVREKRMASRGWAPREKLGTENRLAWQQDVETSLRTVLPPLEEAVRIYRYDGAQAPQEGAAMLMAHAARQTAVTRTSFGRNLFKTAVVTVSFFVAQCVHIFRRTPQVAVLMYHAVNRSPWKLAVSPEAFERQISFLARKGWVVPLADVVSYVKGEKTLPIHAIAITFDDGYCDLLTTILPILERYHIPATVFIPSDFSVQTSPDSRPRLSEEELRALAQSPFITIGSHAQTHRKFTELSPEEIEKESRGSAEKLAGILGKRPRFFAYPFGARSTDAERAVKDAGYDAAFGITEGTIHQNDNLFCLKRVQIDGTMGFFLFRLRLTSAVDWNRRIVDFFRRA